MATGFDDPLAPAGEQFPLARPDTAPPSTDAPSAAGARPWGLRRMGPVLQPAGQGLAWGYGHERQLATGPDGVALLDLTAGPPTAPTTQTVDGEDPPSSEDWINDYAPDEPAHP
jgi:putative ATP-grasp target RiPP